MEHIEGVAEVGEELVATVETLGRAELHVVVVEGVRDDQEWMRTSSMLMRRFFRIGGQALR